MSLHEGKFMRGRKLFLMTHRKRLIETQKLPRAEAPLPLLLRGSYGVVEACAGCSSWRLPLAGAGLTLACRIRPPPPAKTRSRVMA